ncbi:MAG: chemotaxis-specific protein-glutamate methyltransferase CheB [Limisphaerales bacterium]
MNLAIVNDMQMAVEVLRRVITTVPGYQVIWVARDGADAVSQCARQTPDLILMDLLMPVMDGVEATRRIMAATPCAILVVTATVSGNSAKVYEAMGYGALDAVNTPVLEEGVGSRGAQALLAKIHTIARLVHSPAGYEYLAAHKPTPTVRLVGFPPLLAIGASTGGPAAIAAVLSRLPPDFPAAVAVVQHIDEVFAEGLASWLNERTALKVRVATENVRPTPGVVDVAGTNDHLILKADLTLGYTRKPEDVVYRPSVDVFFQSVAPLLRGSVVGVLLTGIGRDGAQGMLKLRLAGHHTIAQDERTSVIYGMPKAAAELNAAAEMLPLDEIAGAVLARLSPRLSALERKPA